jgi:hypothetical protein
MRTAPEIVKMLERYESELQHHVAANPSERWEAKLETIDLVLGWARGGA